MFFDRKEQAEKEAYKFDCEGAHQMGIIGCHAKSIYITIKKSGVMPIYFDQLLIDKKKSISRKVSTDTFYISISGYDLYKLNI